MRARVVITIAVVLIVTAIVFDIGRVPEKQFSARVAIWFINLYHDYGAPVFEKCGGRCNFTPTCSYYAEEAIRRHGIIEGGWLAVKRLSRCTPWGNSSGYDPVPE